MRLMKDLEFDAMNDAAEEAAAFLKAMSNPGRLRLLCALVPDRKTVGELEEALGASQAYVSGQLKRLREQGFVACEREGRVVRYEISDSRVKLVLERVHDVFCADAS